MSKLTVSRVPDSEKPLKTEAGKSLAEWILYLADFSAQVIKALRKGLTFADNFDSQSVTLTLKHNEPQIVRPFGTKRPTGVIFFNRVYQEAGNLGQTTVMVGGNLYADDQGNTVVRVKFDPVPTLNGNLVSLKVPVVFLFE